MTTQTALILIGAVALIGVVAILLKRGILGAPKTQDSTAKQ